jgi:hypothetical protein
MAEKTFATEEEYLSHQDMLKTSFAYVNHRGERKDRNIVIMGMRYGTTEWYPRPGWLVRGWDVEKDVEREFSIRNMAPIDAQVVFNDYDSKLALLTLGEMGRAIHQLAEAATMDMHPVRATEQIGAADTLAQKVAARIKHIIARMTGTTTAPFVWQPSVDPQHINQFATTMERPKTALEQLAADLVQGAGGLPG